MPFPGVADAKDIFGWVPFWWAFLIIAVADDLTQYWYHRLHHQVPWLWRFHRTHHSAPYMGMAMAGRQNIIYTIFFSQTYLTVALTYLGLGYAALFVKVIKSLITTGAHSSIPWDKPLYEIKWLKPDRLGTGKIDFHACHAPCTPRRYGRRRNRELQRQLWQYVFLWDMIFGTGIITRKYPYFVRHQALPGRRMVCPVSVAYFKSKKEGSELSHNGPVVGDAVPDKHEATILKPDTTTTVAVA
jgi:hypothetical protein